MPRKFDLIIAGAGVGGVHLADFLKKRGFSGSIALLEKRAVPFVKPCAGVITLKTLHLSGTNFEPFIQQKMDRLHCAYEYQNEEDLTLASPFIFRLNRAQWLGSLLSSSMRGGVEFFENIQVVNYEEHADSVLVPTDQGVLESRFLVVATGSLDMNGQKRGRGFARGLQAYLSHPDPSLLEYHRSKMGYDFGLIPFGYGWIFSDDGHLLIGIFSRLMREQSLKRALYKYINQKPTLKGYSRLWGVETHPMFLPSQEVLQGVLRGSHRILYIGEAARLVDPFTGEGIYYAIKSANLAAEVLLSEKEDTVGWLYKDKVVREIIPDLAAAWELSEEFYAYPQYYYRKLLERKQIFGELLAGEMRYKEFLAQLKKGKPLERYARE